jgi:hypothetical protein
MPATTTPRRTASSIVVTTILFLGLTALSVAPLSCGTKPDDTSSEGTSQATETESNRAILLNIGIEDETKERPLSEAFLFETPSGARWNPNVLAGGGVTKAFEKHPVGETRTLRFYPEGEEGPALEVPITMKPDMNSVLASSRTDISVYDDSIVVSGPAVPDERMTFDRPSSPSTTP